VGPVVIAGVGVCSAFGGNDDTWEALRRGETAVAMRSVDGVEGFPEVPGARAASESPAPFLKDRKLAKYMSPAASMAVIAAGRALSSAGLLEDALAKSTMGLFVSTGLIAFDLAAVRRAVEVARSEAGELDLKALGDEGLRVCHPLMPFKMLLNMSLGLVSIALGLRGPNFVTYPDAVQSGACLERAVRGIHTGRYEQALVGGTSQGFSLMPICTRAAEGTLAANVHAARPFSPSHAGVAPADAAAFLVVESLRSCLARGATPLAVLGDVNVAWMDDGSACPSTSTSTSTSQKVVGVTGTRDRDEDVAELAAIAASDCASHVVSFDGSWGETAAASVPLTLGAGVEMLRTGRAWTMLWKEQDGPPPSMLLVSANVAQTVRPTSFELRASNGFGGRTVVTLLPWEAKA